VQGNDLFISCPGNDLHQSDIVTVTMRDQAGNPIQGLPAGNFRVDLYDEMGSGRADVFSLTPLASATDANGRLDYLFEPREICRWPDACMNLRLGFRYEGCSLGTDKATRTLNVVRWQQGDEPYDQLDAADMNYWQSALYTADPCLDLTGVYQCPVVTQASFNLFLAHYLHACDISDVPDLASGGAVWLYQNTPNPFNPTTELRLTLAAPATEADLTIYNLGGRVVRSVWAGPLPQGESRFEWNGRDSGDRPVGSGVYLARLRALGRTSSIRMILLR
jgi:hypothetical protein